MLPRGPAVGHTGHSVQSTLSNSGTCRPRPQWQCQSLSTQSFEDVEFHPGRGGRQRPWLAVCRPKSTLFRVEAKRLMRPMGAEVELPSTPGGGLAVRSLVLI